MKFSYLGASSTMLPAWPGGAKVVGLSTAVAIGVLLLIACVGIGCPGRPEAVSAAPSALGSQRMSPESGAVRVPIQDPTWPVPFHPQKQREWAQWSLLIGGPRDSGIRGAERSCVSSHGRLSRGLARGGNV